MWRKQQEDQAGLQRNDNKLLDDSVDYCDEAANSESKSKSKSKSRFEYDDESFSLSWEEQAFAEDASGRLGNGGCVWPPRSYSCTFCRREFRSAQALGGHMNVHRRDRARLKQSPIQFQTNPLPTTTTTLPYHHQYHHHLPNPKSHSIHRSSSSPSPPPPPPPPGKLGENLRISCPRVRDKDHHVGIGILDDGFGLPWPMSKEKGAVTAAGCKRRKTDDERSIQIYVKSSSLVERHHHHNHIQSEVIGLSSSSLHDLDLELRLGGLSKG